MKQRISGRVLETEDLRLFLAGTQAGRVLETVLFVKQVRIESTTQSEALAVSLCSHTSPCTHTSFMLMSQPEQLPWFKLLIMLPTVSTGMPQST